MKWYVLSQTKGTSLFDSTMYDTMDAAWAAALADRASGDYDNVYVLPGAAPSEPEEP